MIISAQTDHTHRRIAAIGTFDGVHLGHRHLIDTVCAEGIATGLIPTVITFNEHPRRVVNPEFKFDMLTSIEERIKALTQAGIEDVILMQFNAATCAMTAKEFIEKLHADYDVDVLIMGFNHRFGSDRIKDFPTYRAIGQEVGVRIIAAEEYASNDMLHVSSSSIRHLLKDRNPETAAKMIGHPYNIKGIVEHGKELGRTIGFPTANISPVDRDQLIPGNGVYAANAVLPDGTSHRAILNIGHRPTVDSANAPISIEAHILDFDGNLYGTVITIEFLKYLRPERRFSSLDELRSQLEKDSAEARKI